MQFPHLNDTQFPALQTVNVYQFQNNFDYSRWTEKTKIKLCNVLWNSDYTDVVKWDTNELRDEWFNSIDDFWAMELRTSARIVPEGYIKLPIPYDVMARYNYLFIDMPIATSQTNMLDYENSQGIRRWYFFIDNIQYLSPNATQVFLSPDIWTNFQNDIDITYMLLERGHAPVAASDVDEYLFDPISNNQYLLAPDVNFDNASITRSSDFVPFGNGKKYVCFASTCSPSFLGNLGVVVPSSEYSAGGTITYSDINTRYGHQLQVNGLSMGNGYDYSDASTPAVPGVSDGLIANNLTVYAIQATECYGFGGNFYTDVKRACPQFLNTIQACFVVDESCLFFDQESYEIAGHYVRRCVGAHETLFDKILTKEDFNYPEELQRFAKLYTSPYAILEVSDNDGRTYTINIEETSSLAVRTVTSVAFPYINWRVYVDGVGGVGYETYTWMDLKDNIDVLRMPNSDWFKYCFDWEIPTFALFVDGETAFMLESFNRNVKQARQQDVVSYHTSMRSANTDYANSCDMADTTKVNTDNSADTNRTNAYNSADLAYRTIDRTCTSQAQNLATANTAIAANEETAIVGASSITQESNDASYSATNISNLVMESTTDLEVERATGTTMNAAIGTVASSALAGAQAGVVMGGVGGASIGAVAVPGVGTIPGTVIGAFGGAVVGGAGGAISAATNILNTGITTDTKKSIVDAQIYANSAAQAEAAEAAENITDAQNDVKRVVYRTNANSSTAQMNNSNATSRANGADAQNVSKTNANNANVTTKTNASNLQSTTKANSGYTREVAELNAKEILENGKYSAMAAINDAKNRLPVQRGNYSGNPQADYMRTRGIQIKVKTQSDSAIRQAGDIFVRFGYALNQIWDVRESGLNLMNHFTYWKASEIWVDDSESSNNAVNTFIHNMFLKGVTVWNDPTEIGRVDVYDN